MFLLVGSALTAALLYGFDRLLKRTGGIPQWEKCRKVLERKEAFWILGAILIAVYGFCYLSYFPGTYAYDAPPQTYQAYDRDPLNTHHPVFHTLFWALCLRIGTGISGGNEAGGLVVYSVCQILFVVAVTMFTVYWIYKATRNVYATLAAYLYYLLTPMLQLMSFSLTKDILFSCFLILTGAGGEESGRQVSGCRFRNGTSGLPVSEQYGLCGDACIDRGICAAVYV